MQRIIEMLRSLFSCAIFYHICLILCGVLKKEPDITNVRAGETGGENS